MRDKDLIDVFKMNLISNESFGVFKFSKKYNSMVFSLNWRFLSIKKDLNY